MKKWPISIRVWTFLAIVLVGWFASGCALLKSADEAIPVDRILFEDDFSDPNSGWMQGEHERGSTGYRDGVYRVDVTGEVAGQGDWDWGLSASKFEDLALDVDVTQVDAPADNNTGFGVFCRLDPESEGGYLLAISGDGMYAIFRIQDREFEHLVNWKSSDVILQGASQNHLRVLCNGYNLDLVVNGQLVATAYDTTYIEGYIGLGAATYSPGRVVVGFDNLVVYKP